MSKIKPGIKVFLEKFAAPLEAIGASPNGVTLLSLFMAVVAVSAFFYVNRLLGLSLFLVSALFDALDGALARRTNRETRFGAYLDSVTDKIVEALLFLCFSVYHAPLAFIAGASSIIISYAKHRADEFKVKVSGGFFERPERLGFALGAGVLLESLGLTNLMPVVLVLVSVSSGATILQRVLKAKSLLD